VKGKARVGWVRSLGPGHVLVAEDSTQPGQPTCSLAGAELPTNERWVPFHEMPYVPLIDYKSRFGNGLRRLR